MFCAGITALEDGSIVASGGNPADNRTSVFSPHSMTWEPLSDMNDSQSDISLLIPSSAPELQPH